MFALDTLSISFVPCKFIHFFLFHLSINSALLITLSIISFLVHHILCNIIFQLYVVLLLSFSCNFGLLHLVSTKIFSYKTSSNENFECSVLVLAATAASLSSLTCSIPVNRNLVPIHVFDTIPQMFFFSPFMTKPFAKLAAIILFQTSTSFMKLIFTFCTQHQIYYYFLFISHESNYVVGNYPISPVFLMLIYILFYFLAHLSTLQAFFSQFPLNDHREILYKLYAIS